MFLRFSFENFVEIVWYLDFGFVVKIFEFCMDYFVEFLNLYFYIVWYEGDILLVIEEGWFFFVVLVGSIDDVYLFGEEED